MASLEVKACREPTTTKAIELLLKSGADIEARDKFDMTSLMEAAKYNRNPKITELLIKAGANVNACDSLDRTALHYAVGEGSSPQGARRGDPDVTKTLLKAGADIEATTERGQTPLIWLAEHANTVYLNSNKLLWRFKSLLKAGANAEAKDNDGKTAWDYAKHNSRKPLGFPSHPGGKRFDVSGELFFRRRSAIGHIDRVERNHSTQKSGTGCWYLMSDTLSKATTKQGS